MTKTKKKNKIAVIVPYRDRYRQLLKFKEKIGEYLSENGIDYVLIVVEQDDAKLFNRGKLLNIGYKEAVKSNCNYVVFHDIDMIPLKVDYSYSDVPIHLATDFLSEDKTFKRELYDQYFGGVTIFPIESCVIINGYSNEYWGWGFEDDDLFKRCVDKGIPYDLKYVNTQGGPNSAIKFNGMNAYSEGYVDIDTSEDDLTIMVTIDPDGIVCDTDQSYDRYTALSIPKLDLTISYDSFRRYKVLMKDNNDWCYVDSKIETNRKTTLVVTLSVERKILTMYQDSKEVGSMKFSKTIPKCIKKELFVGSTNKEKDLFKGIISQVAIYNKILKSKEIEEISTNEKYSLTMDFGKYGSSHALRHYFDMKYISEYRVMDLVDRENYLQLEKCELVHYTYDIEHIIKVPFRRTSYFEMLPHETTGYKNGVWSDINIRYNQLRFHNEMEKGFRDPNKDGLSNLDFKIWNRTSKNNQIHINVGI
jgi:beta-1,4-galactosyltransferase 1